MSDKTKPISVRLTKSEIDQLQARAYTLSASITGVARDLIRSGLAGGDNKGLADRLMQIERRIVVLDSKVRKHSFGFSRSTEGRVICLPCLTPC
jgi:hypothetical protein